MKSEVLVPRQKQVQQVLSYLNDDGEIVLNMSIADQDGVVDEDDDQFIVIPMSYANILIKRIEELKLEALGGVDAD